MTTLHTQEGWLSFVLARSSARRSLCITVDESAEVSVAVPFYAKEKEIHDFIHEKSKWIHEKVREAKRNQAYINSKKFEDGHEFLFLGKKYKLEVVQEDIKRAAIDFDGLKWIVTIPKGLDEAQKEKTVKAKLTQWYRKQAEEILGGRIFYYSRIMKREPEKIAIRTLKRIWGNCDYNTRTIHLNWQIILSPMKVADYVVVHELCHLFHPNHGKLFWRKVEKFMPDYKQYKGWLSANHLDMVLP